MISLVFVALTGRGRDLDGYSGGNREESIGVKNEVPVVLRRVLGSFLAATMGYVAGLIIVALWVIGFGGVPCGQIMNQGLITGN